MAQFYDGITDSIVTRALNRIIWQISYNTLRGTCPNDIMFRDAIPGADANALGVYPESGQFSITNPPAAGNQTTTISWYADGGEIRFRILSVTAPD